MRRNAYLQAVHETGARLTHDIKNLLQSLYALTSAAPREGNVDPAYAALLQRQLPQITRRLQSSLDQLRSPQVETREVSRAAAAWWEDVKRRHGDGALELEARIEGDASVPTGLFDAFLENCLDNAREKRSAGEPVRSKAVLSVVAGRCEFLFEDSGPAVPQEIAGNLFREPVPTGADGHGLGIGLFQVGRLAAMGGYRVELANNVDGRVSFRLFPA
ncbi:MAG: HAMP domain-containing histidine kinase [Betaproteobacteria bacterium]|nr:HAMP domain-containing histidine kinase [Betaproteobacteria bacterium]